MDKITKLEGKLKIKTEEIDKIKTKIKSLKENLDKKKYYVPVEHDRRLVSVLSDEKLRELLENGHSVIEIAKMYGLSKQAVDDRSKRKFGETYSRRNRIKQENEEAMKVFNETQDLQKTSERTGLSIETLRRRFSQMGFKYHDRRTWTEKDISLIKAMRLEGKKYKEIGKHFNTTPEHIMSVLYVRNPNRQKTGLTRNEMTQMAREKRENIQKLAESGKTAKEISEMAGCSLAGVYQILRQMDGCYFGERRTKEQTRNLKNQAIIMYGAGSTVKEIAEFFKAKKSYIYTIIKKAKEEINA